MSKRKYIIIILFVLIVVISLIAAALIGYYFYKDKEQQEIKNSKNFLKNVADPDRIVYKEEDKYYEINKNDELYNTLIENIAKKIDTSKKENTIPQEDVDNIHKSQCFIEFDYNTISKNYILEIGDKSKFIKLLDSGAEVVQNDIKDMQSIKKIIENKLNKDQYYTMNENKQYISQNLIESIPYKYLQQFKQVDSTIYQKIIQDKSSLEMYKSICNLKFEEEIPEDIFDKNILILTLSIPRDITVKVNIGNIKYYYDNKANNYEYTAHLLIVSKIVNYNCIYNINNVSIKEKEELKEYETKYDNNVNNLNQNIFEKNNSTNTSSKNTTSKNSSKQITKQEADKIADEGFKQAGNIAGEYSKTSQTSEIQEVYANNFFTRKYNETDKVYNDKKIKCYVYTRKDDMGNGVSVYIDYNTGKIIGGYAFGD